MIGWLMEASPAPNPGITTGSLMVGSTWGRVEMGSATASSHPASTAGEMAGREIEASPAPNPGATGMIAGSLFTGSTCGRIEMAGWLMEASPAPNPGITAGSLFVGSAGTKGRIEIAGRPMEASPGRM